MRMRSLALSMLVFVNCVAFRNMQAADVITWGTPANITGDSDVVTTGTLVYAYNLGNTGVQTTTVNGVSFVAWEVPYFNLTTTNGDVKIDETTGYLTSFNTLGTVAGNFSTLSSDYQTLLGSGASASNAATMKLTLAGLTPGADYIFQWWINNSSLTKAFELNDDMLLTTSSVGANSVNLNGNVGSTSGNLGQYVTATFTATGTTKILDFDGTNGSNFPLINAFQLREVPEPSTWIMGGLATTLLVGSGLRMRRQKKN